MSCYTIMNTYGIPAVDTYILALHKVLLFSYCVWCVYTKSVERILIAF